MNITKRAKDVKQQWYIINAEGRILGRIATRIADILTGKRREYYSHDIICGDYVIVINAEKVRLTANKLKTKLYRWHSGYPGALKEKTAGEMLERKPEFLIIQAVKGMLPKNKLQAKALKNLKVYAGGVHPHEAQMPIPIEFGAKLPAIEEKKDKKEAAGEKKEAVKDKKETAEIKKKETDEKKAKK